MHNSDDDSAAGAAAAASCLIFFQKSGLALLAGLVKNRLAKVHSALLAATGAWQVSIWLINQPTNNAACSSSAARNRGRGAHRHQTQYQTCNQGRPKLTDHQRFRSSRKMKSSSWHEHTTCLKVSTVNLIARIIFSQSAIQFRFKTVVMHYLTNG